MGGDSITWGVILGVSAEAPEGRAVSALCSQVTVARAYGKGQVPNSVAIPQRAVLRRSLLLTLYSINVINAIKIKCEKTRGIDIKGTD